MQKFTQFIKWPKAINDEFIIGIYGDSPFSGFATEFYSDISIKGNSVKVLKTYNLNVLKQANIIYICSNKYSEIQMIRGWAIKKNILTVSNRNGAAQKGSMINFYEDESKMRFEINYDVLQESDFKISSKLLKLARIVD